MHDRDIAGRTADFREINRVEREFFLDCHAAAPPDIAKDFGISFREAGSVAFQAAPGFPIYPLNRVFGLGTEEAATEDQLDDAIDWLRRNCCPAFSIQVAPVAQPPALDDWLAARGFRSGGGGWTKLRRGTTPVVEQPIRSKFEIREVSAGDRDAPALGAIFGAAFGMPPAAQVWISAMVGRPKMRTYLAYDGDTPIGSGALMVSDGWAWVGLGATAPTHRNQGVQSAMLARRIADGIASGVKGFAIEAINPPPGEEHNFPSYRNMLRAGFEVAYVAQDYFEVMPGPPE